LIKSTFIGSAATVLLAFSAISYPKSHIPHQDPKAVQPDQQQTQQAKAANQEPGPVPAANESGPELANSESPITSSSVSTSTTKTAAAPISGGNDSVSEPVVAPQTYTATAYSLRGRTASGRPVSRGLIAADPSVLPLGTRVRVEAGSFSGEYVVADTGGAVKGRRIDIWTPTAREAMRFGRRAVKLTVLTLGGKRAKSGSVRPRRADASAPLTSPIQPADKQEK
jgi:3D (Asp-Asp-Asp) domain-containing protein